MPPTLRIAPMQAEDAADVFAMMRVFYDSPALMRPIADAVLRRDIADCIGSCPHVRGYVFHYDGCRAGYAMLAMSYSTEYGGPCAWVEDIYVQPSCRGQGIGTAFFAYIEEHLRGVVTRFRLEVAPDNARAREVYTRRGYSPSPYVVMDKECPGNPPKPAGCPTP